MIRRVTRVLALCFIASPAACMKTAAQPDVDAGSLLTADASWIDGFFPERDAGADAPVGFVACTWDQTSWDQCLWQ